MHYLKKTENEKKIKKEAGQVLLGLVSQTQGLTQ
jgi:hypothetical protein